MEAPGQSDGQSIGLPSGVRWRQVWRPAAMPAITSLLSGIMSRTGLFAQKAAGLSALYEQFARRIQPWQGWSPLSLELWAQESLPEGATEGLSMATRPLEEHRVMATEKAMPSAVPAFVSPFDRMGAYRPASEMTGPREASPSRASRQRQTVPALSRPAIQMAVLRTAQTSSAGTSRGETGTPTSGEQGTDVSGRNWRPFFMAENREAQRPSGEMPLVSYDFMLWRPVLSADLPVLEPRLMQSVSPSPRQEVRGGFPGSSPSVLPGSPPIRMAPAAEQGLAGPQAASSLPAQRPATLSQPREPQGIVEKLLERSGLPMPLPGLELRLVSPENQASLAGRPPESEEREPSEETASNQPAPPARPTPQLDIDTIADTVYRTLMRRQQLERERRGLF